MKNIRVGMDISQLAHFGGVATYTQNLARALSEFDDLEMVYFYSSLRKPYRGNLRKVKKYRLPPTLFEMLFNRWRNVSIERFLGPLDVFHSSDWTQPPSRAKKVTTYHDAVPIKYPQWSHPRIVNVHSRRLKLVEAEIDMVIAVSESVKKDLLEVSKIPKEKIRVIYEAPTAKFQVLSKSKIEEFRKKYHLPDKFILAIGGIGERRNLNRIREATSGYNLIISGKDIPWLDLQELELLYNSASLLAYCSLYEGFGIPILDAFACGLPVITSNVASMPEVGGDAPLYVNPLSVDDMRDKIDEVVNNKKLRDEMIEKGFKQVSKFSWEKTATDTAIIYQELCSSK